LDLKIKYRKLTAKNFSGLHERNLLVEEFSLVLNEQFFDEVLGTFRVNNLTVRVNSPIPGFVETQMSLEAAAELDSPQIPGRARCLGTFQSLVKTLGNLSLE
jgi:hypothetical protein